MAREAPEDPAAHGRTRGDGLGHRTLKRARGADRRTGGTVFYAPAKVGGIDGYRDRAAGIVDSLNFRWALVTPLYRVLAGRGYGDHLLVWNDRACSGPDEAETLLPECGHCLGPVALMGPEAS